MIFQVVAVQIQTIHHSLLHFLNLNSSPCDNIPISQCCCHRPCIIGYPSTLFPFYQTELHVTLNVQVNLETLIS
ncbi:hypothetical protein T10_11070 [Trichinella papuae]|uniref:Uncharacterized protein n=1 Tax=Trichinella papuae TaxID=268474 RepID=A0A0V1MPX1_9BILA|nr:hypothetical protein T10_11070 [Trichinella papuae]